MAGKTPEEALDAFLGRIRTTLSCITPATAVAARPAAADVENSLTLFASGQTEPGKVRLTTFGGQGDLLFRLAHLFTIKQIPDDAAGGPYKVSSSYYQYRIYDWEENEIIVYDWHPESTSSIRTPHLHITAARSIILKQRTGSQRTDQRTHLCDFHLPTARIFVEDLVELLIREFTVDPQRGDWEAILNANRNAIELDRTW